MLSQTSKDEKVELFPPSNDLTLVLVRGPETNLFILIKFKVIPPLFVILIISPPNLKDNLAFYLNTNQFY